MELERHWSKDGKSEQSFGSPSPKSSGTTAPSKAHVQFDPSTSPSSNKKAQSPVVAKRMQWILSNLEYDQFFEVFLEIDREEIGFVEEVPTKERLKKMGATDEVAERIWTLADWNKDSKLDCDEFAIAMFLLSSWKKGVRLPNKLPDMLLYSVYGTIPEHPDDDEEEESIVNKIDKGTYHWEANEVTQEPKRTPRQDSILEAPPLPSSPPPRRLVSPSVSFSSNTKSPSNNRRASTSFASLPMAPPLPSSPPPSASPFRRIRSMSMDVPRPLAISLFDEYRKEDKINGWTQSPRAPKQEINVEQIAGNEEDERPPSPPDSPPPSPPTSPPNSPPMSPEIVRRPLDSKKINKSKTMVETTAKTKKKKEKKIVLEIEKEKQVDKKDETTETVNEQNVVKEGKEEDEIDQLIAQLTKTPVTKSNEELLQGAASIRNDLKNLDALLDTDTILSSAIETIAQSLSQAASLQLERVTQRSTDPEAKKKLVEVADTLVECTQKLTLCVEMVVMDAILNPEFRDLIVQTKTSIEVANKQLIELIFEDQPQNKLSRIYNAHSTSSVPDKAKVTFSEDSPYGVDYFAMKQKAIEQYQKEEYQSEERGELMRRMSIAAIPSSRNLKDHRSTSLPQWPSRVGDKKSNSPKTNDKMLERTGSLRRIFSFRFKENQEKEGRRNSTQLESYSRSQSFRLSKKQRKTLSSSTFDTPNLTSTNPTIEPSEPSEPSETSETSDLGELIKTSDELKADDNVSVTSLPSKNSGEFSRPKIKRTSSFFGTFSFRRSSSVDTIPRIKEEFARPRTLKSRSMTLRNFLGREKSTENLVPSNESKLPVVISKRVEEAFDEILEEMNSRLQYCAECHQLVMDHEILDYSKTLTAFHRLYHRACIRCAVCDANFVDENVNEGVDGRVYCANDYERQFPKCGKCGVRVGVSHVAAMDKIYHPECFLCTTCSKPLPFPQFYVHEEKCYCELDYYRIFHMVCRECERPIMGNKCVAIEEMRYHPMCFKCFHCKISLQSDSMTYYPHNSKPYCRGCHLALF